MENRPKDFPWLPMDPTVALKNVDRVLSDFSAALTPQETEGLCQAREALAEKIKGVCNESSEN